MWSKSIIIYHYLPSTVRFLHQLNLSLSLSHTHTQSLTQVKVCWCTFILTFTENKANVKSFFSFGSKSIFFESLNARRQAPE